MLFGPILGKQNIGIVCIVYHPSRKDESKKMYMQQKCLKLLQENPYWFPAWSESFLKGAILFPFLSPLCYPRVHRIWKNIVFLVRFLRTMRTLVF